MRAALLSCLAVLAAPALAPAAEKRPNVVLILADDLGWGDVGFNGRTDWKTPHLDKLASQGTVFNRWYVGAVVCAPSRAALMTGKYPIHNGVSGNNDDLPDKEVTLALALGKANYSTALFGKWHHGKPRPGRADYRHPLDLGFDRFIGYTDARHAWESFPKELWFGREKKDFEGYAPTFFTDKALDFIKEKKDGPFFLYLPYTIPHFNIEALPEDVAEYAGKFREKDPKKPYNATYAAMISRLDKEVGRVLKALDDLGLSDNTIVIFSSDHGATFEEGNKGASAYHDSNRPFRGQKRTLWEGGTRVPAVVRWPGHVPAGRKSEAIIHNIDVLPTLLRAAGEKPDPAWKTDGASVLELWQGKATGIQRVLFWEWRVEGHYQLAAMEGDLKLVVTGNQKAELFDVVRDPGERRDVIAEYPDLSKRLQQELKDWLATETDESKWGKPMRP
jgi:arylsulfatase A-like enzyme